jgi:uncharacterized membrane protein YbhN (UPF0104 family)
MTFTCPASERGLARRSAPEPPGGPDVATGRRDRPPPTPASRRRRLVVLAEVVVLVALVAVVASQAPRLLSTAADDLARLADPSPGALVGAAALEAVSLVAFAQVPRLLLRRGGVCIGALDAVVLTLAANGMSILLPAGSVSSTVWSVHQYSRRGASAGQATWAVVASGFASTVTLLAVAVAGGFAAGVLGAAAAIAAGAVVAVGAAGVVVLTHRAESLTRLGGRGRAEGPGLAGRLHRAVLRLVGLVGEAAGQRAGWATGSAVLAASMLNWLADAACFAVAFWVLRLPVPWAGLLLAYAAGQLAGALVPLPGGLGAVETGTIGVLVGLGSPAAPVIAAVAVYRLLGYLGPLVLSLPAYGWARREVTGTGSRPGAGDTSDSGTNVGLAA